MEKEKVLVWKFNGRNFQVWKRQVTLVLASKKLIEQLGLNADAEKMFHDEIGVPKDAQKDIEAQSIIFNSLTNVVGRKIG